MQYQSDESREQQAYRPARPTRRSASDLPRVWWGLAIGLVLAVVAFFLTYEINLGGAIVFSIFVYTFGASLALEDSAVRAVLFWMATRSVTFPGLIWEFSIDGFLWLIGMKILFAILGFLFGVLCALLGVVVALIISPISYVINLVHYIQEGEY